MVVSIYLDPEAEGVTNAHLRAFEEGHYGPIFGPLRSTPAPQTQQTPAYTYQQTTIQSPYGTVNTTPRNLPYTYQMTTAPTGFPASTGNTAPSDYIAAQRMISPSTDLYKAEDTPPDNQPEERDD